MKNSSGRFAFRSVLVVGLLAPAALVGPVTAQSKVDVETKIDRLERQMRALQRRVFGKDAKPLPAADAAVSSGGATDQTTRRMMADMTTKIATLERQMRQLNGRLEEMDYRQTQLQDALDLLTKDMNLRFSDLQSNASQASAPSSGAPAGSSQPPAASSQSATTQSSIAQPTTAATDSASVVLPSGSVREQYDYAFAFIHANELSKGRQAMEQFITAYPDDALTGNARFWLGRIHLLQNDPARAAQQLLTLVENNPEHGKAPEALVELADALLKLDASVEACDALSEFFLEPEKASGRVQTRAQRLSDQAGCGF